MTQVNPSFRHFPIPMFAVAMGLAGLSLLLKKASGMGVIAWPVTFGVLSFATVAYSLIVLCYGYKIIRYFSAVQQEWQNPIRISFFPVISITLLLLSGSFFDINRDVSYLLFCIGVSLQFILSMAIINSWINNPRYEVTHTTPAWFIPVVGNVVVPVVGVDHGMMSVSWLFFAWGVIFWGILLIIVFHRLLFHPPLPQKLLPTLFILLAPPSVSFLAYLKLSGGFNDMAVTQIKRMLAIQFSLVWWAYTFPLSAFTVSLLTMHEITGQDLFFYAGYAGCYLSLGVVGGLTVRTLIALISGKIMIPEQ